MKTRKVHEMLKKVKLNGFDPKYNLIKKNIKLFVLVIIYKKKL